MKIKIVNFPISQSISANLKGICEILENSKEEELIIFPEGALSGYFPENDFSNIDYQRVNSALVKLQKMSASKNVYLIIGSLLEENNELFNTAILLSPSKERQIYRKINLATLERKKIRAGSQLSVFSIEHKGLKNTFGIQLCREIRFPEQWRVLAMNSAELIIHINNAINDDREYDIWKSHLVSRAAELQRFVISVNAANEKQKCPTIVIDPNGNIIEEIRSSNLVIKDVSLDLSLVSNRYLNQARGDIVSVKYMK